LRYQALERSAAIEEAAPIDTLASTAGESRFPLAAAASGSSASAPLPPVVDVGGRPAELDHVQVRPRCAFVIERKERRCRNFVTEATNEDGDASVFCSDHMPRALAKSRAYSQNEKAARLAREAAAEGGAGVADSGLGEGDTESASAIPKRVSSSQKRMANPFAVQHQRAVPPLAPSGDGAPFADPYRPLHIDIGCAKGRFIAAIARDGARRAAAGLDGARAWNYLGLEIRPALAVAANEQHCWTGAPPRDADGESMRGTLHYVACNVDVALSAPGLKRCSGDDGAPPHDAPSGHLLSRMPSGILKCVSLQFPTPWRKRKHRRRRILQKRLVAAVAALMPENAEFYISSDIVDVALDMCALIEASGKFVTHSTAARCADAISGRRWLARCPFPVLSEREYCCEETGVRVYRETYVRNAL
jgi:tRNA (guanine-N7-)-methyltransferase